MQKVCASHVAAFLSYHKCLSSAAGNEILIVEKYFVPFLIFIDFNNSTGECKC